MSATARALSLSSLWVLVVMTVSILTNPSTSTMDTFVFGGCSQLKYAQGSPFDSNRNSLLTSLVNSASFSSYNKFTIGSNSQDVVYGLFQCRGDLKPSDCRDCVTRSVSQLGTLCVDSSGGVLQLEGCLVKYDNISFLGVEDKTVVVKKCGPSIGYDSDTLTRRDAVMGYLAAGSEFFRVGGSAGIQGVAQCVGDLSLSECQDCLSDAIQRLKTDCGMAAWGDVFLAKCYARYTDRGDHSYSSRSDYPHDHDHDHDDDDVERTLSILVGLIAGVALIILFLSFLRKVLEDKECK